MSSPISFSPKSNYEKVLSALPPKYILNCYFSFPPITIIFGGQKQVWTVARTGAPIQSTSHSTAWAILKHILDHTIPILNSLQWLPIALQMNPSSFPWSTGPAWPWLLFPQYHPFLLCHLLIRFSLQFLSVKQTWFPYKIIMPFPHSKHFLREEKRKTETLNVFEANLCPSVMSCASY